MEPYRDDTDLATELRTLRPVPRPAFAAALDERAAAGFAGHSSFGDSPLGRLVARLRALPPRRLLLPAGATALAVVVVATAVVAVNEPERPSSSAPSPGRAFTGEATPSPSSAHHAASGDSSGVQFSRSAPGAAAASSKATSSGNAGETARVESAPSRTGPFASKAGHRDVERSAEMVLGADPSEVGDDAAKVFDAVHTYDGIVLGSSVSGGAAGEAEAEFDLLIPSAKLGDALAAFSGIDEVRSRHEATDDITAPTIGLGERLQDSRAKVEGLLEQLAVADTDAERAATEAELRAERGHAAALRSRLTKLNRRANLSRVSLRIETSDKPTSSGGGWGAGDALGDAGHILGIAAGIGIVGLAVIVPLSLLGLLGWLANRAWLRRRREGALD